MAEEFVEIEQENDPLGILSKKPATSKVQVAAPVDNDPLGILKKKSTPVVSSGIPSQLPSQPSFPQQGYKSALAQGASLSNNSFLKEISKSIPKGTGEPTPVEGKWSNIVQNVFANLEKAGTDLAANTLTLVKDLSRNPYIPDVSSVMKEVEKSTGKSIPTPWQLDPLGGVIRGLHGNQERMKGVIANNPLPNTFWGKAVSSVASFAPDIAATALLPEAKLAEGASFLAKTGNLLFNNFTKYMAVKEGLSGYGEARKEGKGIGESSLEAVKGAGRGTKTGMEMALLGAGSNMATKSVMNQAEKLGLTGVKGMALKELVNLNTDVLAFGVVSPFANAALEGRWATGEEIANGTGIAALFRIKGGLENIKSNVELNRALRQTQEIKQGVAISNFVDATPESIVEVYKSPETADELHLKALVATKKAKETTDLQKKAQYTAEAITLAKASGVKQATDMVIQNKDGFAELKASNDLPESAKKEFLQKAEEINNLLNPLKKQEVDLDNKIKESEDLFSQFSQQAQQSQDPNQRAELEAKAREAKDNADNLRGQLTEVKFNQNRPDVNAGKEPVMEGDVAKKKELDDELRKVFNYSVYEEGLNSADAWVREDSKKFLADPKKYIESKIEIAKEALSNNPNNDSAKTLFEDNTERLRVFNEITNKYKQNVVQEKAVPAEVKVTEEVKPTEVKVTEEVKDLSKSSEVELEKRLLEIEDSKSGTPERDEFNNIDKELEKREWRKVFDLPLDKVTEVADELIKKNEEQPSGFGSYIESWDARSLKLIAYKYSKENVKKITDSEIIKDYKDAMFGNPTSLYSDGLRLRESVKEAQNRGIDVFKELSKEFIKDGYSEQDAMNMAKRKLEPILKDLKQSSEKPLGLEQKPTEVKVKTIIKSKFNKPINQELLETIPEKDISDVVEKIDNGEAELNVDVFPATDLGTDNKITNNQNVYLLHSQGKEIGVLTVNNETLGNRNESSISGVVLHPDVKNKGIGKEIYRFVNNDLIKNGKKPLKSDWDITPDAINVWNSLIKSGEAKQVGIAENGKPLFEMNKPTEVNTVEQLRAEEQAEYDSMTDPNDAAKKEKIYEKYDKLISPLLEKPKPTEAKPVEEKVTVELLSSKEPPQKAGETIVTLSGKTEAERIASIEQRQKDTKVSDKVVSDNEIVQAAESYFKKSGNYKNSADGRAELNNLRIKARENGLTIDTERDAVTKPNKAGRPRKVVYNNKADGEAVVEPNAKTLRDRDIDTQKVFEELTDSGVFLDVESESGKRMSATQIEAAIKDINEGIPSKRANKYLDALEKGIKEDAFPLYDKGMGGFAPKLADIRAQLGVEKEVIGEPMDEVALNKFLDEESNLTPEEQQDLLDNVENLLYEYETTEAGPEGKVQPAKSGAKEGVPSEAKPSELTKSERQAEYEKIKSNKKKKDFVRKNLPEEFKTLADELTEPQMSEIVDSNFDSKTIKNIQDAIQKQSAAEVLQRQQEGDGGAGGERKRVEQGKQGDESARAGEAKAAEKTQPKGTEEGKVKELRTDDKSILNRINSSENIPDSVKDKFKDNLKYEVKSKDEAKSIAKNIIKEYGTDNAVTLAESNKFHGDVNSFIFSEAINDTYIKESEAKTPEEKLKYAEQWADYAIRFDESARSKGRFISAISDFYKKSPLGMKFVENERRTEDFKKWYKGKEGSYKEVFDELVKDPQFKSLIGEEVQKGLKEERAAQRESNRKKIEDFFDNAKLKGNNLYAVPIPPKVINGALEVMKQAVLAGESVVYAVNKAVEHISKEVKDWDKEKFRKEYEEKLSSIEGKVGKKVKEELPEDAKNRILEKFRKKLKGLDESQKEKVIRKSFKTLVENGALEYNDFKKIIAETIGYGEVTPEEAAKITKLVNDINSVDELASSIRNDENRSEASLLKYQKAKKEAEKSATELNKMVYNKTNISNRLLSIMQLNTLGIPSLVNNPVFNIWNQATVRFPNAVSMTVLDQILYGGSRVSNKLFGTDVLLPENNVVASQKEFFKKLWQGGKLSTEQLFTGLTNRDYFQKEIYSSQIHPFTSAKDLWDWKFNGKNLTPAQVADKSIQATVGLPAEIVARALNIGDKPQRFAAEGAQAAVFAKNLGLKDVDYKYFLEFPKEEAYRTFKKQGFSDEAAMKKAEEIQDRIIKQGEESTFQQENLLNDMINAAFNKAGTAGDIFKRFNMPFLKIPLNAFWSSYNLVNPEVAFLQSAVYGVKAIKSRSAIDIQQSKKWFAHGVTGIALTGIAGALVSNGIVNSDNRNETTKKERLGEKTYEQQNSINVTKLNAYLRGENPDDVKNSLNVDLKWFGNVGNVLNVEALKQEEMTPEQRKDGMSYMEDMFSGMKISSMELIENGVFSSTSGLLTAIDKGGSFADSYFLNLINMGTNIVQPAMFAQMSRAQLPYYSQQKADTFMEQIKNNLLTRSSTVRALSGKYPPSQVGVWGDVLDRKDNFAMKLFGMSSNNKDNFAQPIYDDYKKTDNTAFLPPSVKPEVNGFKLNTSQSKQFEILVGQARKKLAAPFVNDGAKLSGFKDIYSKLSEEDKVKALGIIYKMGYQVAEDEFTKIYPQFYKSNKKTPEEKKESKESSIFRKSLKKFIR